MSDVLSVGPVEDHVRLPLTPGTAQSICNLFGWLLPTPWLVYRTWQASSLKLEPIGLTPNLGPDLVQFAEHSAIIDAQLRADSRQPTADSQPTARQPTADSRQPTADSRQPTAAVSGIKKHVVISNAYQPGKVLIFGWYRPPPAPDVFSNGRPMGASDRQPIQPRSNVHGALYVDYSHGIQPIAGQAIVNGQPMATADLYAHPTLSRLVSNEGPLRVVRYPSRVPVRSPLQAVRIRSRQSTADSRQTRVRPVIVPTIPSRTGTYFWRLMRSR
jgi:hypothetical protein